MHAQLIDFFHKFRARGSTRALATAELLSFFFSAGLFVVALGKVVYVAYHGGFPPQLLGT